MRQSITRALYNNARLIRLPINAQETLFKIRRYINEYMVHNGCAPSLELISAELDLSIARITDTLTQCATTECVSLDGLSASTESMLSEVLTNPEPSLGECPEANLLSLDRDALLLAALQQLSTEEAYVVRTLLLHGGTLQQLSTELGMSRHRVSTVYKQALHRLRTELNWSHEMFAD